MHAHMLMCIQIWVDYHKTKDCISAVMTVCENTINFCKIIVLLYHFSIQSEQYTELATKAAVAPMVG